MATCLLGVRRRRLGRVYPLKCNIAGTCSCTSKVRLRIMVYKIRCKLHYIDYPGGRWFYLPQGRFASRDVSRRNCDVQISSVHVEVRFVEYGIMTTSQIMITVNMIEVR